MENFKNKAKVIFHIDMNMFFCSVALIKDPSLKDKAFAIGRENTYKGVISTASYEARKYGITAGMSIKEAYEKLPSLIVLNGDYKEYLKYHKKFVSLIEEYSKIIEVASIDELFVDMTTLSKVRHPFYIALEIQDRLYKEYNLPCSIGIAPTLYLAKMASDVKKPMGITILRKREIDKVLFPLPVKDIFGIGKKTYPKLEEADIKTIKDFLDIKNIKKVISIIGDKQFFSVKECLLGRSSNIVNPKTKDNESISMVHTFDVYLSSYDEILSSLKKTTKELFDKLIENRYFTKTITITLRDKEFKTINRSKSVNYTNNLEEILDIVEFLLDENFIEKDYRLTGVGFSNLIKESEMKQEYNLFTYHKFLNKNDKVKEVINELNKKYGDSIIQKGIDINNNLE